MQENAGRVVVNVTRVGDPSRAVRVPYTTRDGEQLAGKDYTATSGTLAFAAGQTSASISVPIRNDAVAEPPEGFAVALGAPGAGAIRATPSTKVVTILASEQRPDGWISTRSRTGYSAATSTTPPAPGRPRVVTGHRAQTRSFYVRDYNDGNIITVTGSKPRPGSGVRYYLGRRDVTTAMRSPTGLRLRLFSHAHRQLTMRIRARATASLGAALAGSVRATWDGHGARTDLVKGVVKVRH